MLRDEDLNAAVEAGVITKDQKTALETQARDRHAARAFAAGRDERFRFLRGFNDVFLTLGVLLVTGAFLTQWSPQLNKGAPVLLLGAAVLWLISEVLVERYKAVLPGMAAVLSIGLLCGLAGAQWAISSGIDSVVGGNRSLDEVRNYPFGIWLRAAGCGCAAVLIYYLRFRLPFALLPLGIGIMATGLLALVDHFGFDTTQAVVNAAALVMGLSTFALALYYDTTDPERMTRRADCGFWLHLAAAPFIVHPVISMLGNRNTPGTALITIAVVAVLGIVALIVDRRALLVSSLIYFGVAVGYLVSHTSLAAGAQGSLTVTLGLLGGFVILMGLGWHRLRGILLSPFAGARWLRFLPPVQKTPTA